MVRGLKKVSAFFSTGLWVLDTSALGRPGAYLVKLARFVYIVLREFLEGQINFRAMSLVYTSLLSLVPMLAVSFSVLKAFGVQNQMEPVLTNFLAPLGPGGEEIARKVTGFVDNMKVGVLGSLGMAMLVYTAISLIYKMEDSLNYIWKIRRSRSLSRRFSDYMSVLLVSPIMIFAAIGLTAAVKTNTFVQYLTSIGPIGYLFYLLSMVLPFLSTCAAFSFIYAFLPCIKVRPRSAIAGGMFAGITWEISGWAFASFVASSSQYSAIYSGFAIILLFMIWLYFSWLVFLVGGAASFYHQFPQHLVLKREGVIISGRLKERLALSVLFLIGHDFYHGGPRCTLDSLLKRLRVPVEPLQDVISLLVSRGLVVEAGETASTYLPARDMETISIKEVLDTAREAGEGSSALEGALSRIPEVDSITRGVNDALSENLGSLTLKALVLSAGKGA